MSNIKNIRILVNSPQPLHHQISNQIRALILRGEMKVGDALPSIRALAKQLRVSVITVKTAYENLLSEGLIQSRPAKGFYITQVSNKQKKKMAKQRLVSTLRPTLNSAHEEGLTVEEIQQIISNIISGESE